jgi:hypothetical protein
VAKQNGRWAGGQGRGAGGGESNHGWAAEAARLLLLLLQARTSCPVPGGHPAQPAQPIAAQATNQALPASLADRFDTQRRQPEQRTFMPRISSHSPGRCTTTPLPITQVALGLRMPEGMRCSLYLLPSLS